MDAERTHIALELHRLGAFKDKTTSPDGRGYRLKLHEQNPDAPLSPFYLNLRTPRNPKPGPLAPDIVNMLGMRLFHEAQRLELRYDHVAGIPHAGDPFAEAFTSCAPADLRLNRLQLRKQERDGRRIVSGILEGGFAPNERVLLIDDLITEADSKLEAIRALQNADLVVHDILVVLDRGQGGAARLAHGGIRVHSLFIIADLLGFYQRRGLLAPDVYCDIRAYLEQNP